LAGAGTNRLWWDHSTFSLPKSGEDSDSSADRSAVIESLSEIAVADGVSRSYRPGPWAQDVVVESFTVGGIPSTERIIALSKNHESSTVVNDWIEIERQSRGSHATLLHCRIEAQSAELILESVGDGLVIVVDIPGGWCVSTWPFDSVDQFPGVPGALSTRAPYVTGPILRGVLSLPKYGFILVMTDALGRYCRRFLDDHGSRLGLLDMLPFLWAGILVSDDPSFDRAHLDENFRKWVEDAKRAGSLEDDDITLVIAEYAIEHESGEPDVGA
jgi:hypothetical protein